MHETQRELTKDKCRKLAKLATNLAPEGERVVLDHDDDDYPFVVTESNGGIRYLTVKQFMAWLRYREEMMSAYADRLECLAAEYRSNIEAANELRIGML